MPGATRDLKVGAVQKAGAGAGCRKTAPRASPSRPFSLRKIYKCSFDLPQPRDSWSHQHHNRFPFFAHWRINASNSPEEGTAIKQSRKVKHE